MAIGDTPNQNLFGTNYNPEDEEEKKARLAAQGAMMGAGFPALDSNIVAQVPGIQNIRNPGAFDPANMEPARPIMSAGTVERVTPNSLAVNKISDVVQGLRDAVGTESVSMDEYRAAQATQTPSVESALRATQFTSPDSLALPSETIGQVPSVNAFSAENAGQVNPMMRAQSQEQLQAMQNAPTNGLTTVGGASLSEFLSGQAMPEQGFTQEESPLGGRGVTLTPDQMNALSAEREARLDARLPGDQSVSDRDRRAARGDGISMADQTAMAKANARGATPTEVARGNQVANALGVDLKTGQSLQATGGLTFEQQLAQNKFEFDVNKFTYDQAKEASDEATANAQSATAAKFAVRDQLRQGANVMDKAQRAGKNIGFSTTGATGALLGLVPGTGAYDQKATVETLEADAAFSALQRMRDASKTGGALGNVSERELDLLKATAGSLRVGQSEEQFRENLGQYVERYNEAMLNVYDAFVADYGEEDANEAFKVNGRQDLIPQQGDNQSTGGGTTTETASGRYSVTVL